MITMIDNTDVITDLGRHLAARAVELAELGTRGEMSAESVDARLREMAMVQAWLVDRMRAELAAARAEYAAWWLREFGGGSR